MDVQLYVYDLSKGLARQSYGMTDHAITQQCLQMSAAFLGTQIDAVYHTALVFGGIEYFFGAGIQTCYPGTTHHGQPMEIVPMGQTYLEIEVILEYLESLKQTYTAESYDLFLHNCNNFSNDFAMFLVGKGIPDHITSLPQTVLNTPFGQMLKPQLDNAMREITQVPSTPSSIPPQPIRPTTSTHGRTNGHDPYINGNSVKESPYPTGVVHNVTRLKDLESLLTSAKQTCAAIFFTSATCPPCKICYAPYEELALETGSKAVLIKIDISNAYDIASAYKIRATPTFMTFLAGEKIEEWAGADPGKLRNNIHMLIQMAHPPHPHRKLRLPKLERPYNKSMTFSKLPPLDKLVAKLGSLGTDPSIVNLKDFVATRASASASSAPLPSLPTISAFITSSLKSTPPASLFPIIDLLRLALNDPRISGYYAEENGHKTVTSILLHTNSLGDNCPYTLRIVTLQMACNLFTSPLYPPQLLSNSLLSGPLIDLVTSSLLDTTHAPVRVAAASLAFNIAAYNHLQRLDGKEDLLPESAQVELVASLLEAVGRENESKEGVKGLIFALGLLAYGCQGEVQDLLQAMTAKELVESKMKMMEAPDQALAKEVMQVVA